MQGEHNQLNQSIDTVNLFADSEIAILSQVSHELKTPLTAILGYAELIVHQAESVQECRDAASVILDNSDYLLQILDDLLEVDKPDNLYGSNSIDGINRRKLAAIKNQEFDLSILIDGVYKMFFNAASRKGLFFTISYNTPIPRFIVTDKIRVKEILLNLVSNAIKFTASGGVRITLTLQDENVSDGFFVTGIIRIDVCDSGIGISPEILPRLFMPYQQADSTIQLRVGGTGLGLAISKKIARRLGGEINVTNNPDGGSTFSFVLPIKMKNKLNNEIEFVSDPFTATQYSNIGKEKIDNNGNNNSSNNNVSNDNNRTCRDRDAEEYSLVGCRVLLVEDSEEAKRLFGLILTKSGAVVTYAEDSNSALSCVSRGNYDVILMDVGLPSEDGYMVTQRLRNNGYRGQIIAVTADDSFESREKSQIAGCNGFAAKPIFRNELIRIVKLHYNRSR